MHAPRSVIGAAVSLLLLSAPSSSLHAQQTGPPPPTIRVTSRLVFLDVTVLDKDGHPVVSGLTRNDFQITEDHRPQKIFSFEAPGAHTTRSDENPDARAPLTIIALDLLNSSFSDFAYIRYQARQFLLSQPPRLRYPTELMLVNNEYLELVQSRTRDRAEILDALAHIPAILPYKQMQPFFWAERFQQSIDALREIALQNKGVPGRKNIIWVGHGSPGIYTAPYPDSIVEELQQYLHETTNLMVDARLSLFVIYPGLKAAARVPGLSAMDAEVDLGDGDPFAGDINFGVLVNTTGGKLFYNRNDVDTEMRQSQRFGSQYYTLTYQPQGGRDNGRFRRIRVTVRDPRLHVLTKAGYFAPNNRQRTDPWQQALQNLNEAAQSTLPFDALHISLTPLARHPDAQTEDLRIRIPASEMHWDPASPGKISANLVIAAESLSGDRSVLSARLLSQKLSFPVVDPALLAKQSVVTTFTLRIPRKTKVVRIAALSNISGRIGAAEISCHTLDAVPASATPEPHLAPGRPQGSAHPPAP